MGKKEDKVRETKTISMKSSGKIKERPGKICRKKIKDRERKKNSRKRISELPKREESGTVRMERWDKKESKNQKGFSSSYRQ